MNIDFVLQHACGCVWCLILRARRQFTITTVQTARTLRALGILEQQNFRLCIVDEAHHAPAKTWLVLLYHLGFLPEDVSRPLQRRLLKQAHRGWSQDAACIRTLAWALCSRLARCTPSTPGLLPLHPHCRLHTVNRVTPHCHAIIHVHTERYIHMVLSRRPVHVDAYACMCARTCASPCF